MQPEQIVLEIRRRRERDQSIPGFRIFWVTLLENRDEFDDELQRVRGEEPIVPVVLRKRGLFQDPNSVMNDVTALLVDAKDDILAIGDCVQKYNCVDLLVLSRSELNLAVTSSPLQLPEWFPVMPKHTIAAHIDDLTWSVQVPLSDAVVARGDLQRLLYELDWALLTRVRTTLEVDQRKVQALWDRIRRENENDMFEVLRDIGETLERIKNHHEFRPSTSRSPTLVGRLWFEVNRNAPDKMPTVARALATALYAEGPIAASNIASLTAVLSRPTSPIVVGSIQWSFHLMVTLRSACQLVTAASHADEYPMFPDVLLRATSLDLRRFLDQAIQILKS